MLRALRRARLAAPSDISVVTCDDVPLSEFIDPPIATIARDPKEMGIVAADMLLEQLRGRSVRSVMLPVQFPAYRKLRPTHLVSPDVQVNVMPVVDSRRIPCRTR